MGAPAVLDDPAAPEEVEPDEKTLPWWQVFTRFANDLRAENASMIILWWISALPQLTSRIGRKPIRTYGVDRSADS
jgi:hypothetical protein